jgi:hypothetical protein
VIAKPISNVARLRPQLVAITPDAAPFDWQADDDGPLTELDVNVLMAYCEAAEARAVRDAARKVLRHLRTHGGVAS